MPRIIETFYQTTIIDLSRLKSFSDNKTNVAHSKINGLLSKSKRNLVGKESNFKCQHFFSLFLKYFQKPSEKKTYKNKKMYTHVCDDGLVPVEEPRVPKFDPSEEWVSTLERAGFVFNKHS